MLLVPVALYIEAVELNLKPGQPERHKQYNETLSYTNTCLEWLVLLGFSKF